MKIRKAHHVWRFLLAALLLACAGNGSAQSSGLQPSGEGATRKARSYLFVSPNTRENLTLKEALRKLDSPEEVALIVDGRTLACRLGLKTRIAKTIGSWTGGVEHSTMLRLEADEETVRYADAWLGKRARQKSVLYFQQRPAGAARMYVLSLHGSKRGLASIAKTLDGSGITSRTLVPGARRTLIYVVDLKDELRRQIAAAARRLNTRYRVVEGSGDFIGDDSDRDKAQQIYSQIIAKYENERPPSGNDCTLRPTQSRLLKNRGASNRTSLPMNSNQF